MEGGEVEEVYGQEGETSALPNKQAMLRIASGTGEGVGLDVQGGSQRADQVQIHGSEIQGQEDTPGLSENRV